MHHPGKRSRSLADRALRWLKSLPLTHCTLCGAATGDLPICDGCAADLPLLENACPRCAEPMPTGNDQPCGHCQTTPPAFDTAYSPYRYEAPISNLVRALKFDQQLHHARLLGTLLGRWLAPALHRRPDLIIPVPMHRRRQGERGFNQALELARFVGKTLDLPVAAGAVVRVRETPPQVGLKRRERQRNLRRAFAVRDDGITGASLLLIDDVMTTGATLHQLAATLRRHGASEITAATVARAPS